MSTGTSGNLAAIAELDIQARRRTVQRAMRIGLWIWPSFTVLDAWMCFVAYPGAPFALFLVYRVVVEVALFLAYRASLAPNRPIW